MCAPARNEMNFALSTPPFARNNTTQQLERAPQARTESLVRLESCVVGNNDRTTGQIFSPSRSPSRIRRRAPTPRTEAKSQFTPALECLIGAPISLEESFGGSVDGSRGGGACAWPLVPSSAARGRCRGTRLHREVLVREHHPFAAGAHSIQQLPTLSLDGGGRIVPAA